MLIIKKAMTAAIFIYIAVMSVASHAASLFQLDDIDCVTEDAAGQIYGAECFEMRVPENHSDPSSRIISLNIMRVPAIRESKRPPVFFFAGGPGQAATEIAPLMLNSLADLRIDHDLIFIDQRGTGHSNPLDCTTDEEDFSTPLEIAERQNLEIMKTCVDAYDADLNFYSTPHAIKDYERVRQAFGYEKIIVWGGSYGTRVVIEYLKANEDAVAAAILDGVAPIEMRLPLFIERDANASLNKLFEHCETNPACNAAYPNLVERWQSTLQRLTNEKDSVTLQHPRSSKVFELEIDARTLSNWIRASLYSHQTSTLLMYAIDRATQGKYDTLFNLQTSFSEGLSDSISQGMMAAVLCTEDRRAAKLNPTISSSLEDELLYIGGETQFQKLCDLFPVGNVANDYFESFRSNVPSLILSGIFDPVTPPAWGDKTLDSLTNSHHLVVPGGHHGISLRGCVPSLIKKFAESPENFDSVNVECIKKIRPLHFFIDSAGPALMKHTATNSSDADDRDD